ncbi:hypothetical protein EVG20_g3934 [Dentipellis fragilis]|uniref:Uncharacterized protein n=1 Tax=Dentipellis fragilis TaxID=205917 RepID=A0A4Y9Z0P0_9AGAM|nr:hypothetical protein EVG20_g3934 [Dentipellis fragilis]
MPHVSRRIVNEKQQLMKPSSFGAPAEPGSGAMRRAGVMLPDAGATSGLKRSTQDVSTAFCVESNATLPYFCAVAVVRLCPPANAERHGTAYLPVVDRALLGHELVYAESTLRVSSAPRRGELKEYTHVAQHVPVHADELGKLAIALVYLARTTPQTRRDAHRREHAIVVEQEALEGLLDKHQVDVTQRLRDRLQHTTCSSTHQPDRTRYARGISDAARTAAAESAASSPATHCTRGARSASALHANTDTEGTPHALAIHPPRQPRVALDIVVRLEQARLILGPDDALEPLVPRARPPAHPRGPHLADRASARTVVAAVAVAVVVAVGTAGHRAC